MVVLAIVQFLFKQAQYGANAVAKNVGDVRFSMLRLVCSAVCGGGLSDKSSRLSV